MDSNILLGVKKINDWIQEAEEMTFFVACNCKDCMWNDKNDKCRKTHITIKDARCIDYAKDGLEHTIKNLKKITNEANQ